MLYMKKKAICWAVLQVAAAVGVGSAVAGVAGAAMQADAASSAADAQSASAEAGIAEQRRQFNTLQENYGKIRDLLSPYINAGTSGLDAQRALLGLNGNAAQQQAIDALKGSPIFTNALSAGQNAILQNASATGGLRGGNTQNALSRYSGDLLSTLIQNQIGNLGSVAGSGQNAVLGLGSNSANLGNAQSGISSNIASLLQQQGAAQAGGAIAQGNAFNSGINAINSGIGTYAGLNGGGGGSGFGYTGAGSLFGGSAAGVTIPQTTF